MRERDAQLADRNAEASPLSFISKLKLNGDALASRSRHSTRRWASASWSTTATFQCHERDTQLADHDAKATPLSFIDELKLNGDASTSLSLSWSVVDEAQLADDVQFARLHPSVRDASGDPSPFTQSATLRLPPSWWPFASPKRVMGIFFFPFELIFFINFCLMILVPLGIFV